MEKNANEIVKIAYDALEEKLGEDIEIIKIDEISVIADYLIIASGRNQNQLNAMIDFVDEKLTMAGYNSKRIEGNKKSSWVLMDYGDVIVHVFSKEDRLFYDLERIWKDGRAAVKLTHQGYAPVYEKVLVQCGEDVREAEIL